MGNYNPRSPYILGEEWVPIRNEDLVYSPNVNSVELGTQFELATARQVRTGRFYVNQMPDDIQLNQCGLINIYPAGTEDQTGPIQQVIIPCNSAATTGSNISVLGGGTVVDALSQVSGTQLQFDYNSGNTQRLAAFFAVDQYPVLANKRILNVSLLYSGYVVDVDASGNPIDFVNPTPATFLTIVRQRNNLGSSQNFTGASLYSNTGALDLSTTVNNAVGQSYASADVRALDLGDINNYWDPNTAPSSTTERQPWRYVDLQRFEATSGVARQHIFIQVQLPTTAATATSPTQPSLFLDYLALRVIYCEEKRVAYGAKLCTYAYGMNQVTMRDLSFNADPVLPAGLYLPTLSWVSPGRIDYGQASSGAFPKLNALRQLYEIPSHPATQVNVPFPLEEQLGETFSSVETHILPQLTFHASGGTLTEPHVYGRQAWAEVYGANTATQDIYDDISGVAADYPQVRFYARRFGDTSVSLTLTGVGAFSGSTVSITPTDFDELMEIIDGWREVTLRFATPPSMGAAAGFPAWIWSAVGETAGNRWEILGASAPAISGIGGSLYNLVPSPNQLGTATYQPTSGDTVELTWMPQGVASPWVTGASADAATDAVLLFSQDPPTVTGVGLSQLSQIVTGIGLDCGDLPCCIPSGIGYQRIDWSATSLPATGFGAYELQRWDDLADDFETIMLATDPTLTGFNDYEARVGIDSIYRIRVLNILNFAGEWSSYVTGAPPSPGVSGACADATGALIFTSNADQTGQSNAAYVMQWDGTPSEDFVLPEADMVQYQPMYGRDGSTAFHGTERGLESFSRALLLHAAAIDPVRLADARTLRDLAWAQLPYVCVRDDIGDRWFSSVRVPSVNAKRNRTRHMGRVDIVELTTTPYPVDP